MIGDLKQFSDEILVLLCSGLIFVTALLLKDHFKRIHSKIDKALNKLDWVIIEQKSTDAALEKSFSNGYSIYKSEKKEQLIKEYELINKERLE